jgi:very-short-patch-repair endonuclease
MRNCKKWTKQEIDYLKENYGKIHVFKIAKKLKIKKEKIYKKAMKLQLHSNLKKMKGKLSPFKNKTFEEIYGKEKAQRIKAKQKLPRKDKTWEEIFGKEKAKEMKIEQGRKAKKRFQNPAYRKRMSLANIKKWENSNYRKKHSEMMKERWKNPEYKKKVSQKISEGNKGRIVSLKARKNMSLAQAGIHRSKKFKIKIGKASKKMWQNPDYRKKVTKAIREGLQQKPTLPEKQIKQICKLNILPFDYIGDGKKYIEGYNPDFIWDYKIVELFSFHHTLPERIKSDRRRSQILKKCGFQLLIVWEKQLKKNPQRVTERIVNFIAKP